MSLLHFFLLILAGLSRCTTTPAKANIDLLMACILGEEDRVTKFLDDPPSDGLRAEERAALMRWVLQQTFIKLDYEALKSPICLAVVARQHRIVKILLRDGRFDPAVSGKFCLCAAAQLGQAEIMRLLLNDPRISSGYISEDPFSMACFRGHHLVAEILLTHPSTCQRPFNLNQALVDAASNGHRLVVKLVLNYGNFDPAEDGYLALQAAIWAKNYKIIATLLKSKLFLVVGEPLRLAARSNDMKALKMLLKTPGITSDEIDLILSDYLSFRGALPQVALFLYAHTTSTHYNGNGLEAVQNFYLLRRCKQEKFKLLKNHYYSTNFVEYVVRYMAISGKLTPDHIRFLFSYLKSLKGPMIDQGFSLADFERCHLEMVETVDYLLMHVRRRREVDLFVEILRHMAVGVNKEHLIGFAKAAKLNYHLNLRDLFVMQAGRIELGSFLRRYTALPDEIIKHIDNHHIANYFS